MIIPSTEMVSVSISRMEEIASGVYILEFQRFFDFEAGQIVKIGVGESETPRLYSMASGENDPSVQILFNVVSEGSLTPALAQMQRGDNIYVSEALGRFKGTVEPAWWIAQGTGIAPFASMIRSGQSSGKTLVHGGRFLESFYYQDEFKPLLKDHYIRCCSQESSEGIYHGRVTHFLSDYPRLPHDINYYLCGSSEMVVETRDILIRKGVPFHRIISEIYF